MGRNSYLESVNAGTLWICFSLHPAKNKYIRIRMWKMKMEIYFFFFPHFTVKVILLVHY